MKHRHMVNFINKVVMPQVIRTRDSGQKEYAQDKDNIFANFERIAKLIKVPRGKVLMTYLLKHIEGIVSFINGHKSQRESVEGRIKDAIIYLMLLWAMIYEERQKEKDENH